MARVVVSATGFDTVFAVLDRLERPDWGRLLRLMGTTVEAQTINHFQQQRGPSGVWPPLKSRKGVPLVKTGHLRGSIVHEVWENEVRIGTPVHYGKYHQLGTRTIPQRAFLGLTSEDRDELRDVIEDFIAGELER